MRKWRASGRVSPNLCSYYLDIMQTQPPGSDVWCGLNDKALEGSFVWAGTGVAMAVSYWAFGEPNPLWAGADDCVVLWPGGMWNDENCGRPFGFICEY